MKKCPNCGGPLKIDEASNTATCDFCDTVFSLSESEEVILEAMKTKAQTEKIKFEEEKIQREREVEEKRAADKRLSDFKEGKFSKIIVAFAIVGALGMFLGFSNGQIFAGIIALIQTALFVVGGLMGMQVIKEKRPNFHIVFVIIGAVLIIPFMSFYNGALSNLGSDIGNDNDYSVEENESEEFVWNDLQMGSILPAPESTIGEIDVDDVEELCIYVDETDKTAYDNYLKACDEKGFAIDKFEYEGDNIAFNDEGYKLSTSYDEDDNCMEISLDAPIEMKEISWPSEGVGGTLPVPNSTYGNITSEYSDSFHAYIGNTSYDEYKAYVDECLAKGYKVDYSKSDYYFSAENKKDCDLTVKYYGNNIIDISVYDWSDDEDDDSWF